MIMDLFHKAVVLLLFLEIIATFAGTTSESKITGGEEAEPYSHPYIVSLQTRYLWRKNRICTGSILSRRWILSAGHCVTDYWAKWSPMDAIVGTYNLARISRSQIYPISRRIAHPYYNGGVGPYDISMMRTARDIEYSSRVRPIALPPITPQFYRHQRLLLTGWGALQASFFVLVLPNKLQEAEVSYIPYYECYSAVNGIKDKYERNPLVREHNICTGPTYGGIAGCTGDSGGPLIQYIPMPSVPMTTNEPKTMSSTESSSMGSTTMTSTTREPSNMGSTTMTLTTMEPSSMQSTSMTMTPTTMSSTTISSTTMNSTTMHMLPIVVGVVSWGVVPCGVRGAPTVYSNVTKYMDFINEYLYS